MLTYGAHRTMDLDFRTVARLKAGTQYCFRVRAVNIRGSSPYVLCLIAVYMFVDYIDCQASHGCRWSPVLTGTTRKDPVEGGSDEDGFTWTQNATEVSFVLQVSTTFNSCLFLVINPALDHHTTRSAAECTAMGFKGWWWHVNFV
jgi:hypothetical protein